MDRDVIDEEGSARLAQALASALRAGDVILLEGTLGAGKTTFVGHVARALGLHADEVVTSPTFALVHELDTDPPLVHADLYRLHGEGEVDAIGLAEQLGGGAIALVEWGERFARALGRVDAVLRITVTGESSRRFRLEPRTARGEAISRAVSETFVA